LVCDLGRIPPVCAGNTTADAVEIDTPDQPIDAMEVDGAVIDAALVVARVIDAGADAAVDAAVDAETDVPPDA
jgi:hypothetical protein